ncbi:MAG: hypothetical protein JNJ51_05715 [Methylobacillus glycogenes]|nr:hypothetical protein [Methylobacillus glycogenes]
MSMVIAPQGGLCNRMRALDSALAVTRKHEIPLKVLWFCNGELNCTFDQLFRTLEKRVEVVNIAAPGITGKLHGHLTPHLYALRGYRRIGQREIGNHPSPEQMVDRAVATGKVFVSTYSRFCTPNTYYSDFSPSIEVAQILESYRPQLLNAIAVHIRRTDNLQSISAASIDDFIKAMEAARAVVPNARFFLATDERDVQTRLIGHFGDALLFHPKRAYARNEPSAIVDALVDLYCLASCRQLIGSHWSSFTDTAAQLGGIPCQIVGGKR